MTTNNNTTTTTTARKRWTMYRRAMRLLTQVRSGRAKVITFGEEALERSAREWAGPYLGRFAQLSTPQLSTAAQ